MRMIFLKINYHIFYRSFLLDETRCFIPKFTFTH